MTSSKHRLETLLGHLKGKNDKTSDNIVLEKTSGNISTTDNYRYTIDTSLINNEQRRFYEDNGYLVIRGLINQDQLDNYCQRFKQICCREVEKSLFLTIMKDVAIAKSEFNPNEKAVTKIQEFQFDPILSQYCSSPDIVKYVECFTGPDIMAMHTMLINKPPDPGSKSSRHPLHQDLHYFPFRPADRIVCSWTAMEKVHRQNGCLVVLPGTHKQGVLLQHGYPQWEGGVNKMYHGIKDYDPSLKRVHLEMDAGDTVFFHPLLIHGSGMNRTNGFRKAISCHYASSHCDYIDIRGTTQEIIATEVEEIAKKHVGPDASVSFQDAWKIKGICVHGNRVKL